MINQMILHPVGMQFTVAKPGRSSGCLLYYFKLFSECEIISS